MKNLKAKVKTILKKLRPLYAHSPMGIDFETPFQLVVGTILSAQCTDERVNKVTATFLNRLRKPEDYLKLTQAQLEKLIHSTGFFRNKAKNILGAAEAIVKNHDGKIPNTMQELIKIPGFGRKTANCILTRLYQINEGVCVDTHVLRLSKKLGLTKNTDAIKVERDLMAITEQKEWHNITHFLILHGRQICYARSPRCAECVLQAVCEYYKAL